MGLGEAKNAILRNEPKPRSGTLTAAKSSSAGSPCPASQLPLTRLPHVARVLLAGAAPACAGTCGADTTTCSSRRRCAALEGESWSSGESFIIEPVDPIEEMDRADMGDWYW